MTPYWRCDSTILDVMSTWFTACARDVRAQLNEQDEGSLWILFVDHPGGEVQVAVAFDEAMGQVDQAITDNLKSMIATVPAPAVLLIVPRRDGKPRRADHDLWQQLRRSKCCAAKVIDLVVVGKANYWSARRAAA